MKMNIDPLIRINFILFLLCLSLNTYAQHYVPSSKNSKVEFRVYNHKDGNNIIRGLFTNINGNITFDPKQPATASFDVAVNTNSINTANQQRDNDLQSDHFFSAATFPEIRIKSNKIKSDGSVVYILYGTLTIKNVTKPVKIQFTATPVREGYLFRGSFELSRSAYGVGAAGGDIDDKVSVFIELRTEKK